MIWLRALPFAMVWLLCSQPSAQAQTATAPRSACMNYLFKPPNFNFSVTFVPSPPNCRTVQQSSIADLVTLKGLHLSADVFSVERVEDDDYVALQRVSVARPKGWTIGVDESLYNRDNMRDTMFKMLGLEGRRTGPVEPLSHYVRITVDGLPGVEIGGAADADIYQPGRIDIRSRFVWAHFIVDRSANIGYFVMLRQDVTGRGTFDMTANAFQFVEGFRVNR